MREAPVDFPPVAPARPVAEPLVLHVMPPQDASWRDLVRACIGQPKDNQAVYAAIAAAFPDRCQQNPTWKATVRRVLAELVASGLASRVDDRWVAVQGQPRQAPPLPVARPRPAPVRLPPRPDPRVLEAQLNALVTNWRQQTGDARERALQELSRRLNEGAPLDEGVAQEVRLAVQHHLAPEQAQLWREYLAADPDQRRDKHCQLLAKLACAGGIPLALLPAESPLPVEFASSFLAAVNDLSPAERRTLSWRRVTLPTADASQRAWSLLCELTRGQAELAEKTRTLAGARAAEAELRNIPADQTPLAQILAHWRYQFARGARQFQEAQMDVVGEIDVAAFTTWLKSPSGGKALPPDAGYAGGQGQHAITQYLSLHSLQMRRNWEAQRRLALIRGLDRQSLPPEPADQAEFGGMRMTFVINQGQISHPIDEPMVTFSDLRSLKNPGLLINMRPDLQERYCPQKLILNKPSAVARLRGDSDALLEEVRADFAESGRVVRLVCLNGTICRAYGVSGTGANLELTVTEPPESVGSLARAVEKKSGLDLYAFDAVERPDGSWAARNLTCSPELGPSTAGAIRRAIFQHIRRVYARRAEGQPVGA